MYHAEKVDGSENQAESNDGINNQIGIYGGSVEIFLAQECI
jgi:hypothetical protein